MPIPAEKICEMCSLLKKCDNMRNMQQHTKTDRQSCCICSNRPHLMPHTAMQHNNNKNTRTLLLLLLLHPFNGLFSRTTWVSRYQKGKTSLDLNEARDDGVLRCSSISWTIMQTIYISLQTDNHTNTSSLNFYRPDALPDAQPTVSEHRTHTHIQPFNGPWSGTTQVGRYQKKLSPTHTHPDLQTSFINFLHLLRSIASSVFSLRAWQSSLTTFSRSSEHRRQKQLIITIDASL